MIETENKSEFELTKYNPYLTSYSESIIGILENNAWDITSLYYKAYCFGVYWIMREMFSARDEPSW